MFRLDGAHKSMEKRLTRSFPQLFGPYSHRLAKDGDTLNGLSLKHEGEELVSAPVARGQMKIMGKILSEAERFLAENPNGLFAVVDTPYDCRVPFLFVKESPRGSGSTSLS
jgi:hypothetical protein